MILDENLKLGDTGNYVRILQEKLKILGFYNALITGSFGLTTEVGVKAFQKEQGLEETGIVDQQTWELLFSLTEVAYAPFSNYPTLSLGSTGNYVRELQTRLKALLYYTGPIQAIFDNETEAAVKRLQFHNQITTTGIVNNQTWSIIDTLFGNLNACVKGDFTDTYLTYTVQRGDTLFGIAKRYNTTIDAIKSFNRLSSDILSVGQTLKIPSTTGGEYVTYTVQRGDTLYGIARKYNTTTGAIKNYNGLTSDILSVGQTLKIPTTEVEETYTTYTVQSGDTLYGIARKYNTTVDAIKSLNQLKNNTLSIGQVLKIPSSSQDQFVTYTVQSGDTIFMGNNE